MHNKRKVALVLASIFAAGTANASIVQISPVSISADTRAVSVFASEDSKAATSNTSLNIGSSAFEENGFRESQRAIAYADTNAGFATSADAFYNGSAQSALTQKYTVTNTSSVEQDMFFDFTIEQGSLGTGCTNNDGYGPMNGNPGWCDFFTTVANFEAEILVDDRSVFSTFAETRTVGTVNSATVQTGAQLAVDNNLFDGVFTWGALRVENFFLGRVGAGQSIELSYSVKSFAALIDGFKNPSGFWRGNTTAASSFGDLSKFSGIDTNSFSSVAVVADPSPVNAPATLGLLTLGFLGLGAIGAKKAK